MRTYRKILLAVDLSKESALVAIKAHAMADAFGSELHIIHVVAPIYYGYADSIVLDISNFQEQANAEARKSLNSFSSAYQIAETNRHLELGDPAKVIQEKAESLGIDLIVIGTHGQHGFALLLGATANSVLHGGRCDVLAVRVGPKS